MLIASRAVQGIGAAPLMPTTLAVIVAAFTDVRERNTAIGIWAAAGTLALALGPAMGGLISHHLHWGWIFLINMPIGAITFVITVLYVTESRAGSRAGSAVRRLDLPGLVTSAAALFALTYALIEGASGGWTLPGDPRRVLAGRRGRRGRRGLWPSGPAPPARWSRCACSVAESSAAAPPR